MTLNQWLACSQRRKLRLRQRPAIASTLCTTRSAATTFWRMPMPSAARTKARLASTTRILRTSRRMGSSGGWLNWRLRSGRRPTGQRQSAALVLDPIFEADLPPEIYAYRPGRNAQQAVVELEELLFRGHPDVVDADLADYLEAASYCPPTYEVRSNSVG